MPTSPPLVQRSQRRGRHVGMLSTYPPQLCGLATFTAALELELARAGEQVTVIAVNDGRHDCGANAVGRHELLNGIPASVRDSAGVLSQCDIVIIQHEYGVYGGVDGDEVVDVLRLIEVPAIVVLHTVPLQPTAHQRYVLETICALATGVVVMTGAAGDRLLAGYRVETDKVAMISHGAWSPPVPLESDRERCAGRPQLLTWGLLGPGKGIEHVIRAMSLLGDLHPRVRYTVAGATHPNVLARDGDQYRQSLVRTAWAMGVANSISFDDAYRDVATLVRFVASASVVVLPYDSRDQVTSGVLVEAIAAGRPVIATAFPHAVELLSDGAGIVVPHHDPVALAAAIRTAVTEPAVLEAMTARARQIAPSLAWDTVAAQYRALCDTLAPAPAMVST